MDVVVKGTGPQSNIEQQVDPTHAAARFAIRPLEHVVGGVQGGHYNLDAVTGAMTGALAAGGQVFAVRWNDPSKLMVLLRVTVNAKCEAVSSGIGTDLELILAHAYTANASGGGTIVPTNTSQMARLSNMAPSSFASYGEIRVATTAALTPGTQTLDTAGVGACAFPGAGGAVIGNYGGPNDLWNCQTGFGEHPIVLANNQGFVVRTSSGFAASNTWRFYVNISWIEVAAF